MVTLIDPLIYQVNPEQQERAEGVDPEEFSPRKRLFPWTGDVIRVFRPREGFIVWTCDVIRVFWPRTGSILWPGDCYDSSVIECFFVNLKTGTGNRCQFKTGQKFMDKTWQHITYCNGKRIQLGFGGRSQKEYRKHVMRHGVA